LTSKNYDELQVLHERYRYGIQVSTKFFCN
jgi:hypothetical protein